MPGTPQRSRTFRSLRETSATASPSPYTWSFPGSSPVPRWRPQTSKLVGLNYAEVLKICFGIFIISHRENYHWAVTLRAVVVFTTTQFLYGKLFWRPPAGNKQSLHWRGGGRGTRNGEACPCLSQVCLSSPLEFEVNVVIVLHDDHLITENFPLKLCRV